MKRDHKLFLKDIIEAMESIENFVEDMDLEELAEDDKTSSAVIRKFEIIGEATKHVPDRIKKRYPEVPWKRMAGMRDRLSHAYFGIDYLLVRDAVKIELPRIKPILRKILAEIEEEEGSK